MEEAQWFYEDFIRPLDPALPSLSLKAFAMRIFQHCPLMSQWSHYHHLTAFSEFLAYKTRVPVRGAILLNDAMDHVVLVKGWKKGASWSFPRGKINKDEKDLDCAIREVHEETGFDLREAGLIKDEENVKYIEITMREQHMRLYVFRGVPMDTQFSPRTRKEISKIEWYKLSDLPTLKKNKHHDAANASKFYMVAPFIGPLKKWITQQRKLDAKIHTPTVSKAQLEGETSMDEGYTPATGHTKRRGSDAAGPSDLPEVTTTGDVSDSLKKLLHIGSPTTAVSQPSPAPTDTSKSNALLALLRGGSNNEHTATAPQAASAHPQHPLSQPFISADQVTANVSSGPAPYAAQSPHIFHPNPVPPPSQSLPYNHYPSTASPLPPSNIPFQGQQYSAAPTEAPHYPQNIHAPHHSGRVPMPAPYQQTGDPQFAPQMQTGQLQSPAVPPASRLPPPKLTSHSLALLNMLKSSTPVSCKSAPTPVSPLPPSQKASNANTPTKHLEGLLNSVKEPVTPTTTSAAELPAHPAPSQPKQILQRNHNVSKTPGKSNRSDAEKIALEGLASVTMSRPSSEHDKITRSAKEGSKSPKTHTSQQSLASPITILSRPKRDSSAGMETPPGPVSQTRVEHARSPPEPPKPFQPQILRRSDRLDLNNDQPSQPVPDAPSINEPAVANNARVTPQPPGMLQINYDRRPSQTAAQKEALLSLFGKSPTATNTTAANPSAASTAPVLPSSSAAGPAQPSTSGGTTDQGRSRFTSPDNKAFLLGYLQNVAEGKR